MNNFFILIKTTLINNLGLNAFSKNITSVEEKKKIKKATISMIIGLFAITYTMFIYSFLIADFLEEVGQLNLLLLLAIIASSGAVFFTTVYKASGSLFATKDYELLKSLPISRSVILASKLFELLLTNWIFTTLVMFPPAIIYFVKTPNVSVIFFIILIIGIFVIPFIPVIISALVAIVISLLSSKTKYKNLTTIIGGMIVLIGIMLISFNLPNLIASLAENSKSIEEIINKIYLPATYITNALTNIDFIELLKFILISVIPFVLFILIFNRLFEKINRKLTENHQIGNYRVKALKTNSVVKALLISEARRYFSTPIYVFNTFLGVILLLIGSVSTLFIDKESIVLYIGMINNAEDIMLLMILGIVAFTVGLSTTTSSSISLEGKNLWVLKSLPISVRDIFLSKILLNLILTIPILILSSTIAYIGLGLSLNNLFWILFIGIMYSVFIAIVGLVINLNFPKLDWTSPTVVVKQSASVLITILFVFGSILLPVGIYNLFEITNLVFLTICSTTIIVGIIIGLLLLNKKGVKQFNKL